MPTHFPTVRVFFFFSFFFASTCMWRNRESKWLVCCCLLRFFLMWCCLVVWILLSTVSICIEMALLFVCRFCKLTHVSETLCRAKIKDVRGCADECAFSLYVYMHALRARVCMYVCVRACPVILCAIREQVWWRFNCLILQNIEWPVCLNVAQKFYLQVE